MKGKFEYNVDVTTVEDGRLVKMVKIVKDGQVAIRPHKCSPSNSVSNSAELHKEAAREESEPSLHFEEPPKKEAKLDIEEPLDLRTSLNSDQLNEKLPHL